MPRSHHSLAPAATRQELLAQARRFHAKKHLGQHFLVEPETLARIAGALLAVPGDRVLEIGPGLGFLTGYLAATGARVTAVELDSACVERLRKMALDNLAVVQADFLQYDVRQLLDPSQPGAGLKVAGNVPYQITSRIVARLFGEIGAPSPWLAALDRVVLTVQLEVARRFVATPGSRDYSQITLLTNYYSRPSLLEVVPAESFFPVPQVDSAVVAFVPHEAPPVTCGNPRLLRQIIQAGFNQRRKMLRNNLSFLALGHDELLAVFKGLNFDPQVRAERLSLAQFAMLTDAVTARTGSSRAASKDA